MKFSYKKKIYIFIFIYIKNYMYIFYLYLFKKNIYIYVSYFMIPCLKNSSFRENLEYHPIQDRIYCQIFFFTFIFIYIYMYILSIHYFDIILVCFRVYNFKISYILFI